MLYSSSYTEVFLAQPTYYQVLLLCFYVIFEVFLFCNIFHKW